MESHLWVAFSRSDCCVVRCIRTLGAMSAGLAEKILKDPDAASAGTAWRDHPGIHNSQIVVGRVLWMSWPPRRIGNTIFTQCASTYSRRLLAVIFLMFLVRAGR
jgi:hypothetical protein